MPGYRLTRRARRDLAHIWRYTAERWSVEQADRYYRHLISSIEMVAAKPGLGRDAGDIHPGYRSKTSGSHSIFYRRAASGIEGSASCTSGWMFAAFWMRGESAASRPLPPELAFAAGELVGDLHVTQTVDGEKGCHMVLPKEHLWPVT